MPNLLQAFLCTAALLTPSTGRGTVAMARTLPYDNKGYAHGMHKSVRSDTVTKNNILIKAKDETTISRPINNHDGRALMHMRRTPAGEVWGGSTVDAGADVVNDGVGEGELEGGRGKDDKDAGADVANDGVGEGELEWGRGKGDEGEGESQREIAEEEREITEVWVQQRLTKSAIAAIAGVAGGAVLLGIVAVVATRPNTAKPLVFDANYEFKDAKNSGEGDPDQRNNQFSVTAGFVF